MRKFSLFELISTALVILLACVLYVKEQKINDFQEDIDELTEIAIEYNSRIEEIDSIMQSFEKQQVFFNMVTSNLNKEYDFIQKSTAEDILSYYSGNTESIGGGD